MSSQVHDAFMKRDTNLTDSEALDAWIASMDETPNTPMKEIWSEMNTMSQDENGAELLTLQKEQMQDILQDLTEREIAEKNERSSAIKDAKRKSGDGCALADAVSGLNNGAGSSMAAIVARESKKAEVEEKRMKMQEMKSYRCPDHGKCSRTRPFSADTEVERRHRLPQLCSNGYCRGQMTETRASQACPTAQRTSPHRSSQSAYMEYIRCTRR